MYALSLSAYVLYGSPLRVGVWAAFSEKFCLQAFFILMGMKVSGGWGEFLEKIRVHTL